MDKLDSWELFPYCVQHENQRLHDCFRGQSFSFGQLKGKQVQSTDLLSWNIPVDLIDTYVLSDTVLDNEFICNCSSGYFGPRCEYSFDFFVPIEFKDLVYKQLLSRPRMTYSQVNSTNVTCYQGLIAQECDKTIICLDWRQICDGVLDCANGADERECLSLESNECIDSANDYRCMDGRCIPRNFLFDKQFDCMDKSDEGEDVYIFDAICAWEPSIVCEETWLPQRGEFQCGDGEIAQTSFCVNNRDAVYYRNMFQYDVNDNNELTPTCWIYLICMSNMYDLFSFNCSFCAHLLKGNFDECEIHIIHIIMRARAYFTHFCSSDVYITFPSGPIISSSVYTLFMENFNTSSIAHKYGPYPDYICYDRNVCPFKLPISLRSTTMEINNLICFMTHGLVGSRVTNGLRNWKNFLRHMRRLFSSCTTNFMVKNKIEKLFYCPISEKYISPYRILDKFDDCFFYEDLNIDDKCAFNLTDVFQCRNEPTRCMTRFMTSYDGCDDDSDTLYPGVCDLPNDWGCQFLRGIPLPPVHFIFQELCNGNSKLQYEIDGETDETHCDEWIPNFSQQNHLCDGVWDNENGSDELDCRNTVVRAVSKQCGANEHYCAQRNESELRCLSVEKAGDGNIDCLGASDERNTYCTSSEAEYKCLNARNCISIDWLCNGKQDCRMNDDEELCPWLANVGFFATIEFICQNGIRIDREWQRCNGIMDCPSGEDEWLCDLKRLRTFIPFSFHTRIGEYPQIDAKSPQLSLLTSSLPTMKVTAVTLSTFTASWYCHRGIAVRYLDSTVRCLCPPAYYGRMCEYQSDRLSVFLRLIVPASLLRTTGDTINQLPSLLKILAQLVIDKKTTYHEQIVDVSGRKHIFYLLLPINTTKHERDNTYVRFDLFHVTRNNVEQLAAWKYRIPFPFLPVNRLPLDLLVLTDRICQQHICGIHGHCKMYANSNETYCVCDSSWTGQNCNITTTHCHLSSRCIRSGSLKSICVCTVGYFGSRCSASFDPCAVDSCSYHGQCYPTDQRTTRYACLCNPGFFGIRCEFQEAELRVSFELNEEISACIITFTDLRPSQVGLLFVQHRVLLKSIDVHGHITIRNANEMAVSRFVLLETFGVNISDYRLHILVLRRNPTVQSLTTRAIESNRCSHVDALLLNRTLIELVPLAKVKLYARVCQRSPAVKCFYDEAHLCFCDVVNAPDCLVRIRESTVCDKLPINPCIHGGRCIQISNQNHWDFTCACPACTYGALCQLTIEKYTLSFDVLFGREIRPGFPFSKQSPLVRTCVGIVVCLILIGLILNALCFSTFVQPSASDAGVGIYLLILSLVNQFGLCVLGVKLFFVLHTQLSSPSSINHHVLLHACAILEYLLTILFCLSDWLTVCISIERVINVIKGVNFSKSMSRRLVKYSCSCLFVFTAASFIHQPLNRHIITDPRSLTVWCVKSVHTPWQQKYESVIYLIHLIGPFSCNAFSAVFLVVTLTRNKAKVYKKNTMKMLQQQLAQHKHLVVSPIILILLALPRLILSLVSACTKKPWLNILFIGGYLISFLPLLDQPTLPTPSPPQIPESAPTQIAEVAT
ncbi:unnamed protein product [Rotaria magnacalcarata]|uniref:EGF-like domain-containing protein n=4 Tax=Rotaria magnacalcarata TaxID=392030 RepID=A0A814XVA2_9BILA|nr:unnamed protein product [Rotaria magnacalcarata]CAF1616266.1 unnamed protein product [Rotaria magnacalcarata]